MTRPIPIRRFLFWTIVFLCSTICFHLWLDRFLSSSAIEKEKEKEKDDGLIKYPSSPRPSMKVKCSSRGYSVGLTFDDGPHPIFTPMILKILREFHLSAGFFLLGTSIQSYLSYHDLLDVHQFERPRLGYLLLQNYSSLEQLFRPDQQFYLHGWLHEKNTEMRLQTLVDNISTQMVELGLLEGFRPIYRAPWGLGTSPGQVREESLLVQILAQIGIVPAYWKIDTKDFLFQIDEDHLINQTLHRICQTRGGIVLMHDNRPHTAQFLSRLIRSILLSGHQILSPEQIEPQWKNVTLFNKTRRFISLLRQRVKHLQQSSLFSTHLFRPVQLPSHLLQLNALASFKGKFQIQPNVND